MSFNYIAALSVIETRNIISSKNPVALDLGCQTVGIDIQEIIKNISSNKKNVTNEQIKELSMLVGKKFSTSDFFKSLNYADYKSIDINGDHNSLQFDLNYDIQRYNIIRQNNILSDFSTNMLFSRIFII